ncbi:MAG: hypothetical protein N3G80_00710 [Candidatus Micrarchaeota archaeon]|nr:hypothetical protein [Candidatus Micrarchaeota archaeon]
MKTASAILLTVLFLAFGCSGATSTSSSRSVWVWGWEMLAGVALLAVVFLLSISYMVATLTNDEKLKAWTKKEVGQAFLSVLILIFAVALVEVLDSWLMSLSYLSDDRTGQWNTYVNTVCCTGANCPFAKRRACHIELATDYLQTLYETARMNAITALKHYWLYGFLSNLSFSGTSLFDERQGNLNLSPFAFLALAADFFSIVFELSVKLMMLARAQQIFLDYLWYALFPVMISMGLILRILYFTRKLGGLLIALALSAYIVMPMFYVAANAILFGFMDGANWNTGGRVFGFKYDESKGATLPFSGGSVDYGSSSDAKEVFNPAKKLQIDVCNDTRSQSQINEMENLGSAFIAIWKKYEGTSWYKDFLGYISSGAPSSGFGPKGPIGMLASLLIFSLVVPFLGLMTMLASVKYFSPLIGGDVEISVLSRLI